MIVFHAIWDPGASRLRLWAENRKAYRGPRKKTPEHPFALGRATLAEYAERFLGRFPYQFGEMALRLPSGPMPSPSPELDPAATPARRFAVWRAVCLDYAVSDAARLLTAAEPVPGESSWGSSLVFWREAAFLARRLEETGSGGSAAAGDAIGAFERALPAAAHAMDLPRGAVRLLPGQVFRDFMSKLAGLPEAEPPPAVGFRLEPPAGQAPGDWKLLFFQQTSADRSLFLPASKVWKSGLEELFLAGLGRAARLWPPVEAALSQGRPEFLRWSPSEAYEFLREGSDRLREHGFLTVLPSWWKDPASRLSVRLAMKMPGGPSALGLEALAEFDWQIALGDETLSLQEFREAVESKLPLVKVRGRWMELTPEMSAKALSFFAAGAGPLRMKLGEALRCYLSGELSEIGLPVADLSGAGEWVRAVTSDAKIPETFRGQLRPYQLKGVSWLRSLRACGLGGCLADDMGLGKTVQLLALLAGERAERACGPALLVCPASVVGNWQREIERFTPSLRVLVHHGGERMKERDLDAAAKSADVVLTTYTLAWKDQEHLARVEWEEVVLDEAQNIKNPDAFQTRAVKRFRARQKIALTGTPVENSVTDLWSIMDFANPGWLGGQSEFARLAPETLRRLIRPFVLRRLKTDPAILPDLPEKMEMKVYCNLTREQASLYEAAVAETMDRAAQASGIQRKGIVLSALTRLKQICNHPAQFLRDGSGLEDRSGKLSRLAEMLEEAVTEGDRSLVFTQFKEMGDLLQEFLSPRFPQGVFYLHGDTPLKRRGEMIFRFQNEADAPPVFILSLRAGGTGLNLTSASRVFHFDRWWNPAVETQASDRAHRLGQTKRVQVHKLISAGTVEEKIDRMLEEKSGLAGIVPGGGEDWITELPPERLREFFALRREEAEEREGVR
ncbi:MAG: ATP-dependent helicase [Candidatus Omnitrophica bacterium]|nr:ATP-dependent helicase [Candidatus Omnitrophota bacterium]